MDKKAQQQLIMIAGLAVVLVFILSRNLKKLDELKPGGSPSGAVPQFVPQAMPTSQGEVLFPAKREESKEARTEEKMEWGRDPFQLQEAGGGNAESISGLELMGITTGEKIRPIAIINNELVTIGDKIGKFKILSILSNKVVVTDGQKNYDLKMKK